MKKLTIITIIGIMVLSGCDTPTITALIPPQWNHFSGPYPSPLTIESTFDYSVYERIEEIRLCYTLDGSDPLNNPKAEDVNLEQFSLTLSVPGTYTFRYYAYDTGDWYMFSSDATQTYTIQ